MQEVMREVGCDMNLLEFTINLNWSFLKLYDEGSDKFKLWKTYAITYSKKSFEASSSSFSSI